MTDKPFISIIIPCRNEEKFIAGVIDNILEQDYPKDKIEILVADGMSTDETRNILLGYLEVHPNIRIVDNPDLVVPHGLNKCILMAKGDVIVRMDAHASYPMNYISNLIRGLIQFDADNVGAVLETAPQGKGLIPTAVAIASSHPFGVGNSYFRIDVAKPTIVDTVPFGCYKKEVFDQIGLFDTDLIRNQDDEFNGRLVQSGGKIILLPEIKVRYFARPDFGRMMKMFYQYGLFKPLVNRKLRHPASLRQFIPFLFVIFLIFGPFCHFIYPGLFWIWKFGLLFYVAVALLISSLESFRRARPFLLLPLFLSFFLIHISYGWGYLKGIVLFSILRKGSGRVEPNR